jgi:hypothetical protein
MEDWCKPCCLSDDTEVVITEVLKRLGDKRGRESARENFGLK